MSSMTQEYWNKKFCKKDHFGTGPTGFAIECADFLKNYPKHKKLLDIGCDQGRDSIYFKGLGYDVTAVDYSSQALLSLPKNIKTIHSDIRNIHQYFQSKSLDIIYSNEVLHFLKYAEALKLINCIYALLQPDGFFMFTCKNNKDKWYGKGKKVAEETFIYKSVLRHVFSKERLTQALGKFKVLSFDEGSHVMFGEAPSVYWKVITQKQ